MLERLRIQNFKSWQDTGDMAFGSLTGFFGTWLLVGVYCQPAPAGSPL